MDSIPAQSPPLHPLQWSLMCDVEVLQDAVSSLHQKVLLIDDMEPQLPRSDTQRLDEKQLANSRHLCMEKFLQTQNNASLESSAAVDNHPQNLSHSSSENSALVGALPNRRLIPSGFASDLDEKANGQQATFQMVACTSPVGSLSSRRLFHSNAYSEASDVAHEVPGDNRINDLGAQLSIHPSRASVDHTIQISRKSIRTIEVARNVKSTVDRIGTWLDSLRDEPERYGVIADIVDSNRFTLVCSFVIALDSVCACWAANESAANPTAPSSPVLQAMELFIAIAYSMEVCIKLIVHRLYFFSNNNMWWNLFDFMLVAHTAFEIIIRHFFSVAGFDSLDSSFLRLVRFVKLGRALRLFRALHLFKDLRIMIVSIGRCIHTLFWAFITLGIFLYVFALIFVQSITNYRMGLHVDPVAISVFERHFRSVEGTLLVLYMSCTGGMNWGEIYDAVSSVGPIEAAAFIFFIFFFGFVLTTVLSGIFIEKALTASRPDRESQALENRRICELEMQELVQLMTEMDADCSGTLTLNELASGLEKPYWKAILSTFDLTSHDATMLFRLLEETTRKSEFDIAYFARSIARMKGAASAIDLQALMYEVKLMDQKINTLINESLVSEKPHNFPIQTQVEL